VLFCYIHHSTKVAQSECKWQLCSIANLKDGVFTEVDEAFQFAFLALLVNNVV